MYCADVLSVRNRLAEGAAQQQLLVLASFLIRSVNILRFVGLASFPCSFGKYSEAFGFGKLPRSLGKYYISASFVVRSVTIRSLLD